MPKITILPLEWVLEATDGATIMDAAHEHGLYWPTTCGGEGICTSCACTIDEGPRSWAKPPSARATFA